MNKIIKGENSNPELWFSWLTRKLNSHEAFNEFALGKDPKDVAEDFISANSNAISQVFNKFDEEDKNTFEQFEKLTECEWHVFRILKNQLEIKNNVRFVDFKHRKNKRKT